MDERLRDSRGQAREGRGWGGQSRWRRPAQRESDVAQVGDQVAPRPRLPVDVQIAVIALGRAAVDDPARSPSRIRRDPELLDMVMIRFARSLRELRGGAKADAQRRRQRSRTKSPLLPTAVNQRRRLGASSSTKRQSPWAMDLVRRDRDQVGPIARIRPAQRPEPRRTASGAGAVRHVGDLSRPAG